MSQVQSWQIQCRRCGWANSGAEVRCGKCGYALPQRPGMLVAGSSSATAVSTAAPVKIAQPAGFWVRLVALLLDSVLLLVILTVVVFIWIATLTPTHIDPSNPARSLIESQVVQLLYLTLTLVLVTLLYFVGSMAILGATPLMRLFNLHIVNAKGGPIGFGRALLRWLFSFSAYAVLILLINIPLVFAIALFVLFGFALLDAALVAGSKTKRALHDRLAGTLVIQYLDPDKVEANAAAMITPAAPTDAMPTAEPDVP
ncbi:MAG: RDD family protein, partial [Candidatus Dormiibacterota bacterium]